MQWLCDQIVVVAGVPNVGNNVSRDSESIGAIRRGRHVRSLRLHRRPLDSGVLLVKSGNTSDLGVVVCSGVRVASNRRA